MRSVPLAELGVKLVHPDIPLAHPLDGGRAALLHRSVATTAEGLTRDAARYGKLMGPLVRDSEALAHELLGPLRVPRHPVALARFGLHGIRSVTGMVRPFETDESRALLAGIGAHSMLPLSKVPSGAVALVLGLVAHAVGWPVVEGGSQKLSDALGRYLTSLGGEIVTGTTVRSLDELPEARAYLFDLTPRQLATIAGAKLPTGYLRRLGKYRYGPGVFKMDWALDGPIPWSAEGCRGAGTVHVAGTFEEVRASEDEVWAGRPQRKPFVLLVQASNFDRTRAPEGKHAVWAYCHVPAGSAVDMTEAIESQIERFAPGFRGLVIGRHLMNAVDMEAYNPNYIGGDINAGVQDLRQLFTRPVARLSPYSTPNERIFLCSSSTPPGGGVHGMSGYFAARAALKRM
jgi:phytoene dehydrogenase-like protein